VTCMRAWAEVGRWVDGWVDVRIKWTRCMRWNIFSDLHTSELLHHRSSCQQNKLGYSQLWVPVCLSPSVYLRYKLLSSRRDDLWQAVIALTQRQGARDEW
jgi:hypothetical protein